MWRGFGRATAKWTSKSSCASNFAPDRLLLRSLRPNFVENMTLAVGLKDFWTCPHTNGCRTNGATLR